MCCPPTPRGRPRRNAVRLVFLDPPYGEDLVPRAYAAFGGAGWIAPAALIVAETGGGRAVGRASSRILASRAHGAARLAIWRLG